MSVFAKATASRSARAAWTGVALAGVSALLLSACSTGTTPPAESESPAASGDALPIAEGERDLSLPLGTILPQSGALAFLGPPEEAGVLEASREPVQFAHPLLASTVYGMASARRRRELHGRLAEIAADPEERARHLARGHPQADGRVASEIESGAALTTCSTRTPGLIILSPEKKSTTPAVLSGTKSSCR